jgi:hypothetical protein
LYNGFEVIWPGKTWLPSVIVSAYEGSSHLATWNLGLVYKNSKMLSALFFECEERLELWGWANSINSNELTSILCIGFISCHLLKWCACATNSSHNMSPSLSSRLDALPSAGITIASGARASITRLPHRNIFRFNCKRMG